MTRIGLASAHRIFRSVSLLGLMLLSACTPAASAQSNTLTDNSILFNDFNVRSIQEPAFASAFRATGDTSLVSFMKNDGRARGAYAPAVGESVMRLRATTNGSDSSTRQAQVVGRTTYGNGTYASLVRFSDDPTCGPLGDRPVQAFYTSDDIPAAQRNPKAFSELDFEYLPRGGWSTYTTPKLHLTSWDAFGPGVRERANTPLDGSYGGWRLLIATTMNGEVQMSVDGRVIARYKGAYVPDSKMRLAWRSRILTEGRLKSSELRCYDMDVDWALFKGGVALNSSQVLELVQELRRNAR